MCGGCHVKSTGQIGYFKLISEGAVAAGIRRIEAVTSTKAEEFFDNQANTINEIKTLLKGSKDIVKSVSILMDENSELQKQLAAFYKEKAIGIKKELAASIEKRGDISLIVSKINFDNAEETKNMLFELRNEIPNLFCVIAQEINQKPSISIIINDNLVKEKNLNAGTLIRDLAKEINGGGGGQAFYAQAGGTKLEGIKTVIEKAKQLI